MVRPRRRRIVRVYGHPSIILIKRKAMPRYVPHAGRPEGREPSADSPRDPLRCAHLDAAHPPGLNRMARAKPTPRTQDGAQAALAS